MKTLLLTATLLAAAALPLSAADKEPRLYELRVYTLADGKLDQFAAMIREASSKRYAKYGMTPLGYFTTMDAKEPAKPGNKFYVLLSHANADARTKSWAALRADPESVAALDKLKADKVVEKTEEILLGETDYSPAVELTQTNPGRLFELRTYTTTPGNLAALDSRFRDHTRKLFEKYGMTNLWYFHLTKDSKAADATLVYFLAHKSPPKPANVAFDELPQGRRLGRRPGRLREEGRRLADGQRRRAVRAAQADRLLADSVGQFRELARRASEGCSVVYEEVSVLDPAALARASG